MALFCRSTPDDENATVSSDDQLCTEGVCRDLFLDWSDETDRLMFGRCVGSPPPHEGLPPSQLPYATRLALSAPAPGTVSTVSLTHPSRLSQHPAPPSGAH